ncbi:hypothetical protein UPYG_G00059840 [Umbra pygmaea]|uniref:C2H2-type domain-containing protein n=1 Tax=Umbra pygmaea TaxID=75934 RepID=A0ABD0XC49_UMBPY
MGLTKLKTLLKNKRTLFITKITQTSHHPPVQLRSPKRSKIKPKICLQALNGMVKKCTGKAKKSGNKKRVSNPALPVMMKWGRPKGSKNKPKITVEQEVKQETDEMPIGITSNEIWLNSIKQESYDPDLDDISPPSKDSEPGTEALQLGIKTEDAPCASRVEGGGGSSDQRLVQLDFHSRIHTQFRPFSCDVCLKTFTRKGGLDEHRAVHGSEKPHACHQCGKTFTFKSNLTRHIRFHSDERPCLPPVWKGLQDLCQPEEPHDHSHRV